MMEHSEIRQILQQRSPFLLVDRILEVDQERALGLKNVTGTEPFLVGHFPDDPIFPGVLLVEAMSQVGGVLVAHGGRVAAGRRGLLAAIDKVKFKIPVRPGDQIRIEAKLVTLMGNLARVTARATVDNREVAVGQISYGFTDT